MKFKSGTIVDFILLKKDFYSKLTEKGFWLYIGIVLLGINNVIFALTGSGIYKNIKFDLRTIGILLIIVLVIGFIDAVCFAYPIFDVVKHFKNRSDKNSMALGMQYSSLLTKILKVYVVANIIVVPLNILVYITSSLAISTGAVILVNLATILSILSYFWFNGAITRGLCVLFKLPNNVRGLIFMLVFVWNAMLYWAIGYLLNQILIKL